MTHKPYFIRVYYEYLRYFEVVINCSLRGLIKPLKQFTKFAVVCGSLRSLATRQKPKGNSLSGRSTGSVESVADKHQTSWHFTGVICLTLSQSQECQVSRRGSVFMLSASEATCSSSLPFAHHFRSFWFFFFYI